MIILWIVGGVVGLVVLFLLIAAAVGRSLPPQHVVTATLRVNQPAARVFGLLADPAAWPAWDTGVTKVVPLESRRGAPTCRMHMGRNSFVLLTTRREDPSHLTLEIDDDHSFFSGRWEYELADEGAGTRLTLSEHGTVKAAMPRFFLKYLVDPAMYLKRHLTALAKHLGEEPRITDARRVS